MKYNLLPCPFCGGEAKFGLLRVDKMISTKKNVFIDYDAVICQKCGSMAIGNTVEDSMQNWNRRTNKTIVNNGTMNIEF